MSLTRVRVVRWGVIPAAVLAYPVLAYYSTTTAANTIPALGLSVSLMPVLAILVWLAWRSPRRLAMLLLCAALGGLLWRYRDTLERNLGWVYFIQHAGTYLLLGVAFGLTLTRGRQPLCTRCAQTLRGRLSPEVSLYTRQVTLAWALFFLGLSLISALLFLFGSMDVWSVFANFLSLPLLALMFAVEHVVRRHRLPGLKKYTIMDTILAFRRTPKAVADASLDAR
jgi:uncharacterized membrane protein